MKANLIIEISGLFASCELVNRMPSQAIIGMEVIFLSYGKNCRFFNHRLRHDVGTEALTAQIPTEFFFHIALKLFQIFLMKYESGHQVVLNLLVGFFDFFSPAVFNSFQKLLTVHLHLF